MQNFCCIVDTKKTNLILLVSDVSFTIQWNKEIAIACDQ